MKKPPFKKQEQPKLRRAFFGSLNKYPELTNKARLPDFVVESLIIRLKIRYFLRFMRRRGFSGRKPEFKRIFRVFRLYLRQFKKVNLSFLEFKYFYDYIVAFAEENSLFLKHFKNFDKEYYYFLVFLTNLSEKKEAYEDYLKENYDKYLLFRKKNLQNLSPFYRSDFEKIFDLAYFFASNEFLLRLPKDSRQVVSKAVRRVSGIVEPYFVPSEKN